MPIAKYYEGSGEKVMRAMKKRSGKKKGEQVFYATANKRKMKPKHHSAEDGSFIDSRRHL